MNSARLYLSESSISVLLIVFAVTFLGCGSSKKVSRIGEETVTDLSGEWNDTDSRLVAEEMIRDVMVRPWLEDYRGIHGRNPVVIVGTITNRSHEHIDVRTFVKDLERELINSGEVEFVASSAERDQIRDERKDQARQASEETQKAAGQEVGADFMLIGNISSIVDQEEGKTVKFYQVNLELVNIETNRKAWIGEKKIKKFISRKKVKL